MKFQKISTLLIWSEDFRKLADWYQQIFNLNVVEELDHPQDTGVLFEFPEGDTWLWIGQHSEIKGKNPDPYRHMFNINVESVKEAYDYLLGNQVEFLAPPFKAPTMNKYFATFYDPDGNVVQLIGKE
jgi:catechol 2,3-dioxygenase-like lactoylglutathione lyase family enzyme